MRGRTAPPHRRGKPELGWMCRRVSGEDFSAEGQYLFLRGEALSFTRSEFTGKYGFQYVRDAVFDRCVFDTKDAFWHGKTSPSGTAW